MQGETLISSKMMYTLMKRRPKPPVTQPLSSGSRGKNHKSVKFAYRTHESIPDIIVFIVLLKFYAMLNGFAAAVFSIRQYHDPRKVELSEYCHQRFRLLNLTEINSHQISS